MYLSLSEKQEARQLEMFSGLIICGSPCSFGKFHCEDEDRRMHAEKACSRGLSFHWEDVHQRTWHHRGGIH